ncbi:MAG: Eco57I restriction-modification methylase domain-containing protein [Muribaculaceae bacterium]|nr:Eco57I restriction-modification methylase domain-containing protein [Muribaculaceae bacterium]
MENSLFKNVYNPDVLSCIANLSNDEVFTPPELANKIIDMLPQELFENPDTTFLDPCCKSGVFLREIAKRLIVGLERQIPDLERRLEHIYTKQLFGIAITELTSLLARRSVYCSKYPSSEFSAYRFPEDKPQGNIIYQRIKHTWKDGKCIHCGASQSEYDRGAELETHAYQFIHNLDVTKVFNMKFDVIIGNPPYQMSDGGAQASAKPLYHLFVQQAKKLNPRYLTMIIPARWYAGGKGLDEFRNEMLSDSHMRELHDFPNTDDCFPGVNIRGGVCYFLWDKAYDNTLNLTSVIVHDRGEINVSSRPLKFEGLDIFIRDYRAISILQKIQKHISKNDSIASYVSPRKPFGLPTDFYRSSDFYLEISENKLPCYAKALKLGYVDRSKVIMHREWISKWKVMISRANNIGTELNDDNLNAFVLSPNYICTESYIVVGADLNLDETSAKNLAFYLKTKFVRYLHSLAKSSQDATAKTYRFVPLQDFSKPWTDEELYAKYGLTEEEIAFIESMIRPME